MKLQIRPRPVVLFATTFGVLFALILLGFAAKCLAWAFVLGWHLGPNFR